MNRLSLLLVTLLGLLPLSAIAQESSLSGPQRPEYLAVAASWPDKQYLQADAKGNLFLLRPDTLEVYPVIEGALAEPSGLEEIADPAKQLTRDTITRAAMSPDGDWLVLQGFDLRLFRGGREQPVTGPKWNVLGIGFLRGEPVIAGWYAGVITDAVFKKTAPPRTPVIARWDGGAWQPLVYAEIDPEALARSAWIPEYLSAYPLGDSNGRLWTASAFRPLLREYGSGGKLLSEVMIGEGAPKTVDNAADLEREAEEQGKMLSGGGIKARPVAIAAQIVAEALTEGPDGRLYITVQTKGSADGATVALHRFDPATLQLERLPLQVPEPDMYGSLAAGQDGLYIAPWIARKGIWRMSWERLEAAEWIPVSDVWVSSSAEDLEGAWKAKDGKSLVRFAKGRVASWEDNRLTVRGLVSLEGTEALLRLSGFGEKWKIAFSQGRLRIERDGRSREYTRLSEIPASVRLDPAPLPKPKTLPAEQVQTIQAELERRSIQAAEAQKSNDENQRRSVDAENLRYLRGVTAQVGWIDARRFGVKSSGQAAALAANGLDVLLMLAALPHVERDLKSVLERSAVYSSFQDTLQVAMGGKQLYGTQIAPDVAGEPVVLPLEKRAEVDAARRKLGLPPLPETLATLSREIFQGRPVRIAEGEVIEAPPAAVRQAGKVPVKSTSAAETHPSPNRSPSS